MINNTDLTTWNYTTSRGVILPRAKVLWLELYGSSRRNRTLNPLIKSARAP